MATGAQLGRYHLVAEIASGGMATVYLARLSGMGGFQRTVALKRLHPHLAKNAEFVEMFFDEARLAALIHHPNVVPILEVGQGETGYFLVMEYIEGDTLAALLSEAATRGARIPLSISLKICIGMLNGLHAAHELRSDAGDLIGLVHRDVSPQNVLVGIDGIARITDFGVARAASRLSATRSGQLKGKLAYMAPEQARGEEDVERRTDIFAAGVVLWEALAFKRLFKADNHVATLNRVLSERIVSPRRLNSEVPEQIAAICLKALQREPERRFASCLEFADALERAAAQAGLIATHRDVAAYVEDLAQAQLERQRAALRQWVSQRGSEPPLVPRHGARERSSVRPAPSAPPPRVRTRRPPPSPATSASAPASEEPPHSTVRPSRPPEPILTAPPPPYRGASVFAPDPPPPLGLEAPGYQSAPQVASPQPPALPASAPSAFAAPLPAQVFAGSAAPPSAYPAAAPTQVDSSDENRPFRGARLRPQVLWIGAALLLVAGIAAFLLAQDGSKPTAPLPTAASPALPSAPTLPSPAPEESPAPAEAIVDDGAAAEPATAPPVEMQRQPARTVRRQPTTTSKSPKLQTKPKKRLEVENPYR